METCNILYNGNLTDLAEKVISYVSKDSSNILIFINKFKSPEVPNKIRYEKSPTDSLESVDDSSKKFIKDMNTVILMLNKSILNKPKMLNKKPKLLNLITELENTFSIELDKTQLCIVEASTESIEQEHKTITEVYDYNTTNLNEHLKEIYGSGAYDIIRILKEQFDDQTTAAAYWDPALGLIVLKSNKILNDNFQKLKNNYFKTICEYLNNLDGKSRDGSMVDENGDFLSINYFSTLDQFYQHVKSLKDDFNTIIVKELSNLLNENIKHNNTILYQTLINQLLQIDEFKDLVQKHRYLKFNRRTEFNNVLYEADHFSQYFTIVEKFIEKLNLYDYKIGNETVLDILNKIKNSNQNTLLQAVHAYTCLTHFDELLIERHGNSFEIKPSLKGIEIADKNKYSFHQDTAHEKKSWQQSESISSEKYVANMTKRILNQIRIYDYKTNTYQNKRVDSTSFIVASRNLINDIIYNNIIWDSQVSTQNRRKRRLDQLVKDTLSIHSNPEEYFLLVLENLFGHPENDNTDPLYTNIEYKKLLTDFDLNLLYSVYKAIFDKSNENSLISQEMLEIKKGNGIVQALIQEVSGFVDRNTTMDYLETSYDPDSGLVNVKIKKKYFNNKLLYKMKVGINTKVNQVSAESAKNLLKKYQFKVIPTASKNIFYQINLNGNEISLQVPEIVGGKILGNSDSIKYDNVDIFKRINDINLINFREKILSQQELNEDETLLKTMLEFIDDHLDLKILSNPSLGLQILQSYKILYNPVKDKIVGKYYMMPLLQLAIKAAYANSRYAEADGVPLAKYLESLKNDDGIYKLYINNIKHSKLFSKKFNNVKYTIAGSKDKVLDLWIDAISILSGEASKATTKDKLGNSIPNNSVNKLGCIIQHYLLKLQSTNVNSLMFAKNYTLIKGIYHDLEVTTWNHLSKSIKNFSTGELFFHSIFNKFWGNYIQKGSVVVLPTTFSDKTTFINYEVDTKCINNSEDILKSKSYVNDVLEEYINTIGLMYQNVWSDTKQKLELIAEAYNKANNTKLNYRSVLQNLSESNLIKLATSLGITLELDKDYRIINKNGKKVTAVNEELEYYATKVYNNKQLLAKYLENEKFNFVQNLLDSNCSYQVIDFTDDITNYLGDTINTDKESSNILIKTILSLYENDAEGRKSFFNDWVDASTGKLIIAKLNDQNIVGVNNLLSNFNLTLNPLFDKFFYVESLLSNNLRMSLTGSEINHPNKAFNTSFIELQKANLEEAKTIFGEITGFYSNAHEIALNIIKNLSYVGDLNDEFIDSLKESTEVKKILRTIYEDSLLTISNVSQGTQFKRNVIIPATLQYCLLNIKDGIPLKIKCAVIRDEKADVWNYRGDHEKPIDASDGAAYIDPFQSILENKSLGSQAVGFIKKPIWHSYDPESGTAFLAKFATDTMTNEAMRLSLNSHSSLYKLFKKATNLQWKGDVNLTQSIILGDLSNSSSIYKWFLTIILGNTVVKNSEDKDSYIINNHLLYEDAYGNTKEIKGFDKTTLKDGRIIYYTEESTIIGKLNKNSILNNDNLKLNKVYHVFRGDLHLKFDTYQKAQSYLDTYQDAHTINSLFELHSALGGINCVNSEGEGSEFNNEVVVNFMNNVGTVNPGYNLNYDLINQTSCNQPLKLYHIGYLLNNTAVKEGAKNINQAEVWYDDSELNYFEVDSDGLGMQMNADHDIIDSELTEFSQVITATSAYGYTHENCNEIFQGLAFAAILASKKSIDAVNNFLKANFEKENLAEAYSDLYEVIGRIILVNNSIKDKESLLNIIIEAVNKVFYKSKNHNDDSTKIPFSDPNIYSDFVSTLASTINRESIKRKHPGSGNVMVPAYNTIQYFEFNGYKAMAPDVLSLAREDFKLELLNYIKTEAKDNFDPILNTITIKNTVYNINKSTTINNLLLIAKTINPDFISEYETDNNNETLISKHLIKTYLNKLQLKADVYDNKSWFMPSDNVDIIDEQNNKLKTVELNSLDTYYKFKDGLIEAEITHKVKITADYKNGKYKIALDEDANSMFILENILGSNEYNIHFKTGGFDETIQRRTQSDLSADLKNRLFNAALEILPDNSIISLAETTAELILSGLGGLTSGSIAGYNSIYDNADRHTNVEIIKTSNSYDTSYFDANGVLHTATIAKYKKVRNLKSRYRFRTNITVAHNLRPSLIRWQYIPTDENNNPLVDSDNNVLPAVYKNIFDLKVVKDSYQDINRNKLTTKEYRKKIQEALHALHDGYFIDDFGNKLLIVKGTLENTAAELVMSNMHKEKFGIGKESLYEVLLTGEKYFLKKTLNKPNNTNYDLAFLKETGQNTLITFNKVVPNGFISEVPFDKSQLSTNSKDEIVLMKGNRELFEVGKWVNVSDEVKIFNDKFYVNGKLAENLDEYRLKDKNDPTSIQKQLIYLKKYQLVDKLIDKKGKISYKTNILYAISDINVFKEAFKNENLEDKILIYNAEKQRSSIIRKIYESDKFKLATILSGVPYSTLKFNTIKSSLSNILGNYYIPQNVKDLLLSELDTMLTVDQFDKEASTKYIYDFKIKNPEKFLELLAKYLKPEEITDLNTKDLTELLIKNKITKYLNKNLFGDIIKSNKIKLALLEKEFLLLEAHNKWVSFLDSLKFISSRIPAQTLQSFMSMNLIGWSLNSKNIAYVSHFLTYLQGSDYDIDKAYIMSLSYDSNGMYIGWSNLFDYSTVKTLEASKTLPVPKKILIQLDVNGLDLNSEINTLLSLLDDKCNITGDENNRVEALKLFTHIIQKLEANTKMSILENELLKISQINYSNPNNQKFKLLLKVLNGHEFLPLSVNIAELAYKNVASANIYAVAHDVRNRDQAYTAIAMDILKKAADNSPKGKSSTRLNMFNPLTKYIMQYLNLVGKNVISIAANGEKVWFNAYYYWHQMLLNGDENDIKLLKFKLTLSRIDGRAGRKIKPKTITHLPDLNTTDIKIKNILLQEFEATEESLEYVYVDLLISQLLSAATDNAKELILDRINAGLNFARMYIYAMMTGFNIDDIVAFMTSPVSLFIDRLSQANIFLNEYANNSAVQAINISLGIIGISKFLHGTIHTIDLDPTTNEEIVNLISKSTYIKQGLLNFNSALTEELHKNANHTLNEDGDYTPFKGLGEVMLTLINTILKNPTYANLDLRTIVDFYDTEINTYISYCLDIIEKLKSVKSMYNSYLEYIDDINEFKKLYDLSSEISTISSALLGLNQGLPTDDLSILKRLISMSKLVYSREKALNIVDKDIYEKPKNYIENEEEENSFENVSNNYKNSNESKLLKIQNNKLETINRILENNPTLENVEERLDAAHEAGLINGFDIIEYLKNDEYKLKVKDYYNLIMGTLNGFYLLDEIPLYKAILESFKTLIVAKNTLASKSRLITKLVAKNMDTTVTDQQLKNIINISDKLNTKNFIETCDSLVLDKPIEGFNPYFENTKTIRIDFNTINGLATFKHWMENEFYDWTLKLLNSLFLPDNKTKNILYNNGVFKHLVIVPDNDRSLLSLDVDLLNPDVTTVSREGFDEILRGVSELEKIKFLDSSYSIADLLQLYNLVVNNNKYGSERFTTIFKSCTSPDNIENKYLRFVSELDAKFNEVLELNNTDYLINIAPLITPFLEKFATEAFIKVIDPVQGYILKSRTRNNTYKEYPLLPPKTTNVTEDEKMKCFENFALYSPFEMPNTYNQQFIVKIIDFDLNLSEMSANEITNLKNSIENILKQYSLSSKIFIIKDC